MQVQDFNFQGDGPAGPRHSVSDPSQGSSTGAAETAAPDRQQTEISYLKKRIEHLELVVETARSLMTSNQERLLRRLHDLPNELMALTTALHRLDHDADGRNDACANQTNDVASAGRVA